MSHSGLVWGSVESEMHLELLRRSEETELQEALESGSLMAGSPCSARNPECGACN